MSNSFSFLDDLPDIKELMLLPEEELATQCREIVERMETNKLKLKELNRYLRVAKVLSS